jgi:hypothetical protein
LVGQQSQRLAGVDRPLPELQNQQQLRNKGAQRTQNFNSMRGFGGARMRAGGRRR